MMTCHVCGGRMDRLITDLPFKVSESSIVILKGLPVLQCNNCSEYVLEDAVMAQVETILGKVDKSAELEIIRFAA